MEPLPSNPSNHLPSGGVYVGEFRHALDGKRRVSIPSDWRDVSGDNVFYVLRGIGEKCLYFFTESLMREKLRRLTAVSVTDSKAQRAMRSIFAAACRAVVDAHGRVRVSDSLLDYAGIRDEAVLVGVAGRFELWNPETWNTLQQSQPESGTLLEAASFIGL
jgi:MraZ protein